MLRRLISALVIVGVIAQASAATAHHAMALNAALGGDAAPGWLCSSPDADANPDALRKLTELAEALGEDAPVNSSPTDITDACPDCIGFAAAFVLPAAALPLSAPPHAEPAPAARIAPRSDAARFLQPPGRGPPSPSV